MTIRSSAAALASLLALAACGDDDAHGDDHAHTAVGTLASSPDTFIGFVSDSTAVTGYVCDAGDIAYWFQGPVTDGAFEISMAVGSLSGTLGEEGAIEGSFTLTGVTTAFSVTPTTGSTSGLWNGGATIGENDVTAGIIVRDDGQQRGVVSSRPRGVMAEPMIMPSPMLAPTGMLSVDGIGVIAVDHIVSPRDPIVSPR